MRKIACLSVVIAAFTLCGSALADEPDFSGSDHHWLQDTAHDCWAYVDQPQIDATVSWDGGCKARAADGQGKFTVSVGGKTFVTITGAFSGGKLNGTGEIAYADGAFQRGAFKEGKLEGAGKHRWSCGDSFEGTFHNGDADGTGTFVYCQGGRYVGGVHAGKIDGHGVWTMATGGVIEGNFVASKSTGEVVYKGPDGTTLKGDFAIAHNDPAFPPLPTTYPDRAQRLEEEGQAWVGFTVGTDGRTSGHVLEKSSGYSDLDEAALAAGPTWHMIPATIGGTPIPLRARRAVTFKLVN